jgi:hypothetical protein
MPSKTFPKFLPSTSERVPQHTDELLNERIGRQTESNVASFAADPLLIDLRLHDLEREWDIERALEANAATVLLIGLLLGHFMSRRLYALPAMVALFLLQHALQGWCPPVSLFRRLGIRTQREIDEERYALKLMRGDFRPADAQTDRPVHVVMQAVRR